jgi:hypothetical protein
LEWGFAGTAQSTPAIYKPGTNEIEKPSHTVWTHWVDSKTTEEVRDEGDMWPRDDGSGGVVERGSMVNPASGKVESYEEIWADLELESKGMCWVLKTESDGVKGMMIRVGNYIQGVLRKGPSVNVGSWGKLETGQGEARRREWKQVVLIGMWDMPGPLGDLGIGSGVGDKFMSGSFTIGEPSKSEDALEWECVEFFEWS